MPRAECAADGECGTAGEAQEVTTFVATAGDRVEYFQLGIEIGHWVNPLNIEEERVIG